MIFFKGKLYKPTKLLTILSFILMCLMGFAIEGCNTFSEMIIPVMLLLFFGYFVAGGLHD